MTSLLFPFSYPPYQGFLNYFFSFFPLQSHENKKCLLYYHSFPFRKHSCHWGGFTAQGSEGGLRVGQVWEEGAWMPMGHALSDTLRYKRPLAIQKTCSGKQDELSGQKVQFKTDSFSSLSPSSFSILIHQSQLQSSPAMKESDPKFYFRPSDALHLTEINVTIENH